jgi:hypothetical protein
MRLSKLQVLHFRLASVGVGLMGCAGVDGGDARAFGGLSGTEDATAERAPTSLGQASQALSFDTRLANCAEDPRVVTGLVSQTVCAGAGVFFEETFDGNGRTCGSCHPVANNTTIDLPFITALHDSRPDDPLFVFENNPDLAELETTDLLRSAAVLENVDGFGDPTHRFVSRGVSHVLSTKTSINADTGDGTTNPPSQRAGWGGDGSLDGTLRGFLEDAIKQHLTKTLDREPGVDFRLPTAAEANATEQFQLNLGRQNELDLERVTLFDPGAEEGRRAFLDPNRGRCNFCHSNAGANSQQTGNNRNFDTGTRSLSELTLGSFDDRPLRDAGFGGRDLAEPNFSTFGGDTNDAFGNGTFSPPPLIEAADTAPFFHDNLHLIGSSPQDLEDAIVFYSRATFNDSPAALALTEFFGTPLELQSSDLGVIARFLRALNGAFNMDIGRQRLEAALTLVRRFGNTRADVQTTLMELARVEIDDAIEVLSSPADVIYPVALDGLALARDDIHQGLGAPTSVERENGISNALARLNDARDQVGANVTFQLGQGNLMY